MPEAKKYFKKSPENNKIILLSDQPKGRISGPNVVITNIYPFLEREVNIKWKVCPGIGVFAYEKIPQAARSVLSSVLSFLKLLLDDDLREARIINAHGVSSWLPAIWLAKFLNKTSLITFHETYEYTKLKWFFGGGRIAKWVWGYTVKNADYIIDVSNTIKLKKSFYIPNGVDASRFSPVETEKRKKTVLFVGRMSPEKGIVYYMEACKIIRERFKKDVEFVAVTNTDAKNSEWIKIAHLIKDSGVSFVQEGTRDIAEIYRRADVLVTPSLYEAFGLVNLEAMSCGVPVVATAVGGIPNVVKDGIVGFLVSPKDSRDIAEKVVRILEDDNLKEELRKNCLEWAKNFSWEKIAKMYLGVFKNIINLN